jgi:hypothetical protein
MVLEDQKEVKGVSPQEKKPYHKPQLQIYGDLGSITSTVGTGKNEDHGDMPGADKT